MKNVLGIDIGGTNTKIGLVDKLGDILCEINLATPTKDSGVTSEAFVKSLYEASEMLLAQIAENVEIIGVGIGAPKANYYTGCIEFPANLPWAGVTPLFELFKVYFKNIPIKMTNDANAAAIGEMVYGGAIGMKNFITITLGTGLGSGFVTNGNVLYGCDGFAGELGHITAYRDGRKCGCGKRGCLETYASATGLRQTAFELISQSYFAEKTLLKDLSFNEMTSKTIAEAASNGDKLALDVFERTGDTLGRVLADMLAITSPEAIFVYGGLAKAGELILAPIRRAMNANVLSSYRKRDEYGRILPEANAQLLLSHLNDKNGAVLGAAALIWSELEKL
ncbi:MAG: ROK family protein [Bacteroidales bacterium]